MKGLLEQIARFGFVGLVAFGIDYGTLMLLSVVLGFNPILSAAISYAISTVFNYLASMNLVFQHRKDFSRQREFITFVVLSLIGLGINELCIWLILRAFGTSPIMLTASKIIATAIVMVWNFVTRRLFLDAGSTKGIS